MLSDEDKIVLDWLYDIIGESYVMCDVVRISGDIGVTIKCCKCKLSKNLGEYKLELILPKETLILNQDGFEYIVADLVHPPEYEDNILIYYIEDFFHKYNIHIVPVKRVLIPKHVIKASERFNYGRCWSRN